ncbi:MAG: alpha/beta hydrolase [Ruminococcus sp.]|nr:alpha/beta hydrolase [Ruminococcus sp.]
MLDKGFYEFDIVLLKTHVAVNIPENPIATIQIIHGMSEHKERYYNFMKFLGEKGFITITADNIGHGKSIYPPHELGYICDEHPDNLLIDTAYCLSKINHLNYPSLPHFMIGHSMGSLIARCCLKYDSNLDGVILIGTPCYSRLAPFADLLTSELEKKLSPDYRNEIIREWSEKFLNRNFEDISHSWICSNPEVVMAFNNDPLCNFTYTLSGYQALTGLMKQAYSMETAENPDMPIKFISGKDDPCMLSEEKFFEAIKSLENIGYRNITHKLYVGMRHEILNETDKMLVWNDISDNLTSWTERKVKQWI